MVNDVLTFELVGPAGSVTFHGRDMGGSPGVTALAGLAGTGLAPRQVQWFEGAGDGARWRGSRTRPRTITMRIDIIGADRTALLAELGLLALLLDQNAEQPRLRLIEPSGDVWSTQVVFVAGLDDWAWGVDTDGRTRVRTSLTLQSGDPHWTRETASDFEVRVTSSGRGLLPKLSRLRLTSSQAMGSRTVESPGDTVAYPVWQITGPGSNPTLIGAGGEVLRWEGTLAAGEVLTIDTQRNTVVDQTGANRYDKLASAPRFWSIRPGISTVSVTMDGATTASRITCAWRPRRQVMI